ncbi:MAG TPA: alpha-amylase family protein [Jatrophihabitans sp.]|jgi:amylosucrase|uniref:alpha-amylase family protein n=1 Tax=Jatrophihabitans sp. TaxID=1932789 RepID=UPI002EEEEBE1
MHSSQQPTGALPASAAAAVESRLVEAVGSAGAELFLLRLQRWWPDLHDGLASVYGTRAEDTAVRLIELAADAYAAREPELKRLDLVRSLEPDWFQQPDMMGYAAYADRFAGDLAGVSERVEYLRELGVTYLHLMPLLRPREGDSDGGYAVADYRDVQPGLGTMRDLRALAHTLRESGISLVLDLVLNHVAREHEWARAARAGDPRYRAYFHTYADRELPDAYECTLPEVFPDFAPGNFSWDEELQAWVWTTFNSFQWDVNWANPDVFVEYADILLFLANVGVEVVRLDAIAFLWKRLGTDCQNQPEVHAITQALHALTRIVCPALLFKAEAIVGPADLVHYLGQGPHYGKVSDLAYHNSLMVQIWSMLASGDARLAARALGTLPPAPSTTAWITYLRGHDDIGWAIDDGDAAAVGLSGHAHRAFLSDYYAGRFPGSAARGLVFQSNPATGDRRISGTSASLAGIEAGDERGVARVLLGHALTFGWGGIPVIWSGDELAMPNDPDWAAEPGHGGDNRWTHRPRLSEADLERRTDPTTVAGQLFGGLRALIQARARVPHLDASVSSEIAPLADPGILPVLRRHPLGALLGLYNVTDSWRPFPWWRLDELAITDPWDALSNTGVKAGEDGNVWLAPYQAMWIV